MALKKDLVIKITALTVELEGAKKTIGKLTQKNKELSSTPVLEFTPVQDQSDLVASLTKHNAELRLSNTILVSNNDSCKENSLKAVSGRGILISMPWYKRMFLTSNRIHSILINGQL
jgi:hypothetical protein